AAADVAVLGHRQMREQTIRRGAMPMQRIGRDHHSIAWMQRLRLLALEADTPDARQAIQRLPHRMRVPRGARTWRERHHRGAHTRWRRADDDLVLKDGAGKSGRCPLLGGALSSADNWHGS